MIDLNLEEYIKSGLKDRNYLISFSLIKIVSEEIKRLKKTPLFETTFGIEELSILIKLKSELLLAAFGLVNFERRKRQQIDDEEITEIFSVLEKNFSEKVFIKKPYTEEEEEDIPVLRLSKIVREILEREKLYDNREIERSDVSIQEITEKLKERMTNEKRVKFKDIMTQCKSRLEIVATFLAILLLCKTKFLRITQKNHFKEIYLQLYEQGRIPINN